LAVFHLTSWQEVEQLEPQVAKDLKTPFTSIITSSEAFSTNLVERRKKRVSVSSDVNFDEEEEPANEPKRPKGKMKAAKFGKGFQNEQLKYGGRTGSSRKTSYRSRYRATETNLVTGLQMPVVLPPVNVTGLKFIPIPTDRCLLYMDAVNIVVMKDEGGNRKFRNLVIDYTNATFSWDPSYVSCNVSNNTVGIAKLTFNASYTGYWKLVRVTMLSDLTISPPRTTQSEFMKEAVTLHGGTNTTATQYMDVESFYQYAYACSGTQAAFMPTDNPSYMVGIALNNIEVGLNHSPVWRFKWMLIS
uniref:Capsid protein n=1 Tax=Anisakis simplex TaxID=6269 RepID=A0A0M3J2L1_ANISI